MDGAKLLDYLIFSLLFDYICNIKCEKVLLFKVTILKPRQHINKLIVPKGREGIYEADS